MASEDDADDAPHPPETSQSAKAPPAGKSGGSSRAPRKRAETHVGSALRSAYDAALREDVPDEFLDLLKKLS